MEHLYSPQAQVVEGACAIKVSMILIVEIASFLYLVLCARTISHDLRGPKTSLLCCLHIFRDHPVWLHIHAKFHSNGITRSARKLRDTNLSMAKSSIPATITVVSVHIFLIFQNPFGPSSPFFIYFSIYGRVSTLNKYFPVRR